MRLRLLSARRLLHELSTVPAERNDNWNSSSSLPVFKDTILRLPEVDPTGIWVFWDRVPLRYWLCYVEHGTTSVVGMYFQKPQGIIVWTALQGFDLIQLTSSSLPRFLLSPWQVSHSWTGAPEEGRWSIRAKWWPLFLTNLFLFPSKFRI